MMDKWDEEAKAISIHALREEGDIYRQPECPAGSYFYPRPPRGGRPYGDETKIQALMISIHALREEGDRMPSKSIAMA